jgi:hypothetical protein
MMFTRLLGATALCCVLAAAAQAACVVTNPAGPSRTTRLDTMTSDKVSLTGGCIDGIPIGQNTPAAGNFSALTVNGVAVGSGGLESDPVVGSKTGLIKADGAGNISAAVAGTDYLSPTGSAAGLTSIPAGQLTGTVSVNRFNTGTGASSLTFLRGDGTWATPASGATPAGISGDIQTNNGAGGLGALTPAAGIATWLATPSSANLLAALTTKTGTGNAVFATSPTLTTPNLGTPSAVILTNGTGLSLLTGVTDTLGFANGGTGNSSYTNGQILIGNTSTGGLSKATLTQGANITITNGNGAITIASTGGGGSALSVTDGTNSVASTATLTFDANSFLVSGSAGSATVKPTSALNTQTGASYTISATTDPGKDIQMTNGSATTITLPAAATAGAQFATYLECDAGCTINRAGSDLIDGATSLVLAAKQKTAIASDGTKWRAGILPALDPSNAANLISGNLAIARFNSGTLADSTHFWRGDGTWAVPAGGGGSGAVTLISTQTANNTATNLAFTSGIAAGFHHKLTCNIRPATSAGDMRIQFTEDGSTWIASSYGWTAEGISYGGAYVAASSTSDTGIRFRAGANFSNTDNVMLEMMFYGLGSTGQHRVNGLTTMVSGSANNQTAHFGGSYDGDTTAIVGLRVVTDSGNITSGTCNLYSVAL